MKSLINFIENGYWRWAILIFLIATSFFGIPILVTQLYTGIVFDANASYIGSTIGGIITPIIAFIAVILTFLAFYVQFKANELQANNFKIQQFESNFFELVRLHRENVSEIDVNNKKGRDAFVELTQDFNFLYNAVRNPETLEKIDSVEKQIKVAYLLFYFGLHYPEKALIFKLNNILGLPESDNKPQDPENSFSRYLLNNVPFYVLNQNKKDLANFELRKKGFNAIDINNPETQIGLKYRQGLLNKEGFQSQLGHYFRHLFHTVNFVHQADFLNLEQKYNYVKTIRAQLSTFEQTLFFYNSVSTLGRAWELDSPGEENNLISIYNLIKNIPLEGLTENVKPTLFYPNVNYEIDFRR
jgi:hypothetical protein